MLKHIVHGRRRITAEFTLRPACVMDPTAPYSLVLLARYDLAKASSIPPIACSDLAEALRAEGVAQTRHAARAARSGIGPAILTGVT